MALVGLWVAGRLLGHQAIISAGAAVADALPDQFNAGKDFLSRLVKLAASLGWVTVLVTLWPATWYGAGLSRAFDILNDRNARRFDGLRGRAFALVFVVLLPILVVLVLVASFLAPGFLSKGGAGYAAGALAILSVSLVLLALLVAGIYALFAPGGTPLRPLTIGAGVGASLIVLVTVGYVGYLRLGTRFGERYATSWMTSIALLALWLYLVHAALLIGFKTMLRRAGEHVEWLGHGEHPPPNVRRS